jgi:hypothetical protein
LVRSLVLPLEPDGRLPLGAECRLADGRLAKVVRRSAVRDSMVLAQKDDKYHFKCIRIYDALLRTENGEKVRQERIITDTPAAGSFQDGPGASL